MGLIFQIILLICRVAVNGAVNLTEAEEKLTVDLIKSSNIQFCIIHVEEITLPESIIHAKKFSSYGIYVIFMKENELQEYVLRETVLDVKTLVVYKTSFPAYLGYFGYFLEEANYVSKLIKID